ncbi:polysaccharide pyruvyl transferase family protein [Acinetobacter indicus]|uniref:polysaccharide pyruvyl transferase family protein n=1 Tax=Acinetobacter indicus TaxID=756892 RepID=UPI00148DC565|nr:polysaccharide pyruvyl transferase family protein [Acinetobacter indicus]NOJ68860.1 polysaccharide pyruvyl transferase family protein [Acinetobacter indicus]
MKYSIMTYAEGDRWFNIGDYVQSLAAKQFLPQVDSYVNRECLGEYKGEPSKIILNGWFTHHPETWVPADNLIPLFVSLHINSSAADRMLSKNGITYLKKHEPIGCRDHYTVRLLKDKGIKAYFTGCLTLTLDSYAKKEPNNEGKIYIVDPLYGFPNKDRIFTNTKSLIKGIVKGDILNMNSSNEFMQKIFSKSLLNNAEYIKQELPSKKYTEEEKFQLAEDLLEKYSTAKLVITSRIHCALPCLALGTPVIYLNGFEKQFDACRMEGLSELFHTINVNRKTKEISSNFPITGLIDENITLVNKSDYLLLADELKKKVSTFINNEL